MLEKYPVLKRAVANQYQVILAAAATTLAVATVSPLPFLILTGVALAFFAKSNGETRIKTVISHTNNVVLKTQKMPVSIHL